jgi:hypothetical protein
MNFAVFSRYYFLATQGLVPDIKCQTSDEHLGLFPRLEDEDQIVLICTECSFRKKPGLNLYNSMKDIISRTDVPDGE